MGTISDDAAPDSFIGSTLQRRTVQQCSQLSPKSKTYSNRSPWRKPACWTVTFVSSRSASSSSGSSRSTMPILRPSSKRNTCKCARSQRANARSMAVARSANVCVSLTSRSRPGVPTTSSPPRAARSTRKIIQLWPDPALRPARSVDRMSTRIQGYSGARALSDEWPHKQPRRHTSVARMGFEPMTSSLRGMRSREAAHERDEVGSRPSLKVVQMEDGVRLVSTCLVEEISQRQKRGKYAQPMWPDRDRVTGHATPGATGLSTNAHARDDHSVGSSLTAAYEGGVDGYE